MRAVEETECVVCGARIDEPLYVSEADESLTSLCTVEPGRTVVHLCGSCGHLQTRPMADLERYYASTYKIVADSEEEDQLYRVVEGRRVYRSEHQVDVLLATTEIPPGARLLDYGAAKGATVRQVVERRPDVQAHFYDVTDEYLPYWRRLVSEDRFATHRVPGEWYGTFDVVVSFFMLEHVDRPVAILADIHALLAPDGEVHLVVPNAASNVADFVVVDHVNHFSASSLEHALRAAGFGDVALDGDAHDGAWVVRARRGEGDGAAPALPHLAGELARAREIADFWSGVDGRIEAAERSADGRRSAVYGAGFYGTYLHSRLGRPELVEAFVDQNPFLQGREHLGRPIVAPADLDPGIDDLFVGLNPATARDSIEGIASWRRPTHVHFL